MVKEIEKTVKGDEINRISTFRWFGKIMIELLKGYPVYQYYGIIEHYEKEKDVKFFKKMSDDGLIEISPVKKGEQPIYRLSLKGIDFAISIINLFHGETMMKQNNKIVNYTKTIKILTLVMAGITVISLIFSIFI